MSQDGATPPGGRGARQSDFLRLLGVVARRDYVRTVRRRGFIFGTLLLPLGLVALLGLSAAPVAFERQRVERDRRHQHRHRQRVGPSTCGRSPPRLRSRC